MYYYCSILRNKIHTSKTGILSKYHNSLRNSEEFWEEVSILKSFMETEEVSILKSFKETWQPWRDLMKSCKVNFQLHIETGIHFNAAFPISQFKTNSQLPYEKTDYLSAAVYVSILIILHVNKNWASDECWTFTHETKLQQKKMTDNGPW